MSTSNEASVVFVNRVSIKFIILFQSVPKLTDWKSVALINTKRTMSLININLGVLFILAISSLAVYSIL